MCLLLPNILDHVFKVVILIPSHGTRCLFASIPYAWPTISGLMLIIEIDVTLCYLLDDILLVDDEYGYVVILSLYCCCHIIMLMPSILVVGSYHSFATEISMLPTCWWQDLCCSWMPCICFIGLHKGEHTCVYCISHRDTHGVKHVL